MLALPSRNITAAFLWRRRIIVQALQLLWLGGDGVWIAVAKDGREQ